MPQRIRPKLTYANVVATIALFIALGGASAFAAAQLAKNSVGTKQLKDGAVTGEKIKNATITSSKINLSSLRTVPNASHADTATSANTAGHAGTATSAGNADQLGGSPPSAYRDSCPAGTQLRTADLCEAKALEGHVTYLEAISYCAALGWRLPSPAEAYVLHSGIYAVWTDAFWTDEGHSYGLYFLASTHILHEEESGNELNVDCVTAPINS